MDHAGVYDLLASQRKAESRLARLRASPLVLESQSALGLP